MRTFGYVALALAQGTPESGTGGVDFVKLIADATWLSKSVLLILLLFSAVSWAIILGKLWQYRRADRDTHTFLQVFRKSTKFSEVQTILTAERLRRDRQVGLSNFVRQLIASEK